MLWELHSLSQRQDTPTLRHPLSCPPAQRSRLRKRSVMSQNIYWVWFTRVPLKTRDPRSTTCLDLRLNQHATPPRETPEGFGRQEQTRIAKLAAGRRVQKQAMHQLARSLQAITWLRQSECTACTHAGVAAAGLLPALGYVPIPEWIGLNKS